MTAVTLWSKQLLGGFDKLDLACWLDALFPFQKVVYLLNMSKPNLP